MLSQRALRNCFKESAIHKNLLTVATGTIHEVKAHLSNSPKVKTPKEQSTDPLGSRASDDKTAPGLGQPSYEGVMERGVVLGGLQDVTKSFGAVVAIQGVSFELLIGC
jgi:hypothetical protein